MLLFHMAIQEILKLHLSWFECKYAPLACVTIHYGQEWFKFCQCCYFVWLFKKYWKYIGHGSSVNMLLLSVSQSIMVKNARGINFRILWIPWLIMHIQENTNLMYIQENTISKVEFNNKHKRKWKLIWF